MRYPVMFLVIFIVGCGQIIPQTPAEKLAAVEITSQEVDRKIIELVELGVIKGDIAVKVAQATAISDAAVDAARITLRAGGDIDPKIAAATTALAAVSAILEALQKRSI